MPASTAPIGDWGIAVITSFTAALALFLGAIPRVIGFLAILIIGWFVAGALAGLLARLLRGMRFNELAARSGFAGFVRNMGVMTDPAGVIATAANWFVRLMVLVVAFDALGLPAVSQVLQTLLLWLPNLVVALMVLVIGGLAANALAGLVRGATAESGVGNPDFLAAVGRIGVWGFAIVIAVNQIGIATTLVNTLFMGFVAALALALGLAFGLGGRDTAGEIVRGWYLNGQRAGQRLVHAGESAAERTYATPNPGRAEDALVSHPREPAPVLEERPGSDLHYVADPPSEHMGPEIAPAEAEQGPKQAHAA
jgi:hypothetical protein